MDHVEHEHEHDRDPTIGGAVLLSLVHVPCCGAPLLVIALGLGGATTPWLGAWSQWAHWTIPFGAAAVAWSWWRISGAHDCPQVRRQRWILSFATALLVLSLVAHPFIHG